MIYNNPNNEMKGVLLMEKEWVIEQIISGLGGKDNIRDYSHCSTRLRFKVYKDELVNTQEIESINEVLSVIVAAGQYQVVIGSNVSYYFPEVEKVMAFNHDCTPNDRSLEDTDAREEKKNIFSGLIELVSGLFTPILDVLIGAGILKGLVSVLVALNVIEPGTGSYEILNAASDALYYFLPLFIAVTASRKFKTNSFVSLAVAAALLHPGLSQLSSDTLSLTFFGIPFKMTNFNGGVFPIIFAIILLRYVEKMERKFIPEVIRSRIAPFVSLMIVVPATIIIFGPLGSFLSEGIAYVYQQAYAWNPTVAGGFIGALAQLMVVFGIHWGLFPIIFSNIEQYGYDTILAVFGPSIIAQSGAALGVYLRTKNSELKKTSFSATIMGFFGISEPAIYGVTLKYKKAFMMAIIGGGIGGSIAGATGARAVAVAVASVPTFPAYYTTGFSGFLVGYFSAFVISAILTYFFGFEEEKDMD